MADTQALTVAERPKGLIAADDGDGMDLVRQYVQIPRVKVIQNNRRTPFKELFEGSELAVVPTMLSLTNGPVKDPKVPAFYFTPLYFFPEWITWNPIEARGSLPSVRDRSFEPTSEIAQKARDDKRRNSEPCPEMPKTSDGKPLFLRHLEHLNFVVAIHAPSAFAGLPVTLGFASGEHRSGSNLSTLIQARNPMGTPPEDRVPIYAMTFAAYVRERKNSKGEWFGIDCQNPPRDSGVSPWIGADDTRLVAYREQYELLKKAHVDKLLVVEQDEEDLDPESAKPADSKKF